MLIVGAFRYSVDLEHALSALELIGIDQSSIIAVPMDIQEARKSAGSLFRRDRRASRFDIGIACGTAFAVVGMSRGFVLAWGPIIWGLISGASGFLLGVLGKLIWDRRTGAGKKNKQLLPEVTVIVRCGNEELERVETMLWEHRALSVGTFDPAKTVISAGGERS